MDKWLIIALAFTIATIIGSVIPWNEEWSMETSTPAIPLSITHIVTYILNGLFWYKALGLNRRLVMVYTVIAPITEIAQLPVPYRTPCIDDLVSNIIGLAIAIIVIVAKRLFEETGGA